MVIDYLIPTFGSLLRLVGEIRKVSQISAIIFPGVMILCCIINEKLFDKFLYGVLGSFFIAVLVTISLMTL